MRPRQRGDVVERCALGRVCDGVCHPGFRSPSATSTLGFLSSGPSGRTRQAALACDAEMSAPSDSVLQRAALKRAARVRPHRHGMRRM